MASRTANWPEPPRSLARPYHSSDLALRDYLALQEEHECLRQHLDHLRTHQTSESLGLDGSIGHKPTGSPTQAVYPPSESGSHHSRSSSRSHSQGRSWSRRSSLTPVGPRPRQLSCLAFGGGLDTVMDESTIAEVAADEARLSDVNVGIKRALTELLNCDTIREDRAFRTWVQCRLMDTERELRTGRRRRSAPESGILAYP